MITKRQITQAEFAKAMPDCMDFLKLIKERAPVKITELIPLVTYHSDPVLCERYCWSMLQNLNEYKFIKMSEGVVEIS